MRRASETLDQRKRRLRVAREPLRCPHLLADCMAHVVEPTLELGGDALEGVDAGDELVIVTAPKAVATAQKGGGMGMGGGF